MAVAETTFRAMGSAVHIVVVDGPEDAGDIARRRIVLLEARWSRFLQSSDLTRLNQAAGLPITVHPSTLTLVQTMIRARDLTEGRFDPTVLPAMLRIGYTASLENPTARTPRPPSGLTTGCAPLSAAAVDEQARTITLPLGTSLDPGGIGKGLAADLAVAELMGRGSAGVLISIGGDLAAAGTAPAPSGWTVAIEDPHDPQMQLGRIAISGGGVATSTVRSSHWQEDGVGRQHVIDPATAVPLSTDLAAATVVSSCGWMAEAHATAVLVVGRAGMASYAAAHALHVVAVTSEHEVIATPHLSAVLSRSEVMA